MRNRNFFIRVFYGFICLSSIFSFTTKTYSQEDEKSLAVRDKCQVAIEYTVKLKNGNVIDTTDGTGALNYLQGYHELVPGLERAIEGMKAGESKHVVVKPEDAYGKVIPEAFIEVKKEQLSKQEIKIGNKLETRDDMGRTVYSIVEEIRDKTVLLNFNHPLAGKTLYFDVKVINVKDVSDKLGK